MNQTSILRRAGISNDGVSLSTGEAMSSNDDVSIADWKKSRISNYDSTRSARAISAMMTSAVMSSQSAVDKKRKSWISDDDIISDVITISSELQYIQSLTTVQPVDDDKKPAKERTQGQLPVGALQNIFQTGRTCDQRIEFEQRLFKGEYLKEEDDDCAMISWNHFELISDMQRFGVN
ncbi:hypothetical protein F511_08831 [Dorcoceras hygrometricum]|uniref:Uncharacterized protein n=1 Tax=Dorcoceras hygrometricum TaxID=472368 RepID=A0A2Z7ACS6_9LAMI|nr:hypothetical protein F511_08831 [Dorcoceras hygrometricum]